jgi:hypothetical protein
MTDHAITPPRELMEQWASEKCYDERDWLYEFHIATRAAQWGADQELEACVKWLNSYMPGTTGDQLLRPFRRPKPPSLKEQALKAFTQVEVIWATDEFGKETNDALDTIRRALEALDD